MMIQLIDQSFDFVRRAGVFFLSALLFFSFGCYPDDLTSTDELDLVLTDYDRDYFAAESPRTFFMPDSVALLIDPNSSASEGAEISLQIQNLILSQIALNLKDLGYTRVEELEEGNLPDVVVLVSAVKNTWVGVDWYSWWGYWDWYPWYPGWGWGPGWGYPPSYPVYWSYETGSVLWQMIDPEESNRADQELGMIWFAGINGLVRSKGANNEFAIRRGINKAFEQSPYLTN